MADTSTTTMANEEKKEGKVAREIENVTAEMPSDTYLWSAVSVMGLSLALKLFKKDDLALFIGQWAAPLLITGVYNKIVKTEGSD